MEQEIGLKGVGNARQLGGYRIGNRRIRDSLLLRTAGLGHITQEAKEALQKKYRVQTVVDLRTGMERDRQPDPEIPGAQNLHLPVIEMEELTASVSGNIDPKKLALFTDQSEAYMDNALDALGREFGSVYSYLSEALGVGDEEIGFLRRIFLTEQD